MSALDSLHRLNAWVTRGVTDGDRDARSERNLPVEPRLAPTARWSGLIPRDSPAYRRGSRHDGTDSEIAAMRGAARGSPFDAVPTVNAPAASAPRAALAERLARLSSRKP